MLEPLEHAGRTMVLGEVDVTETAIATDVDVDVEVSLVMDELIDPNDEVEVKGVVNTENELLLESLWIWNTELEVVAKEVESIATVVDNAIGIVFELCIVADGGSRELVLDEILAEIELRDDDLKTVLDNDGQELEIEVEDITSLGLEDSARERVNVWLSSIDVEVDRKFEGLGVILLVEEMIVEEDLIWLVELNIIPAVESETVEEIGLSVVVE